jgi:ATP-dependent DNA ligase
MVKYESFHYIYPPRPKNPIPPSDLINWEQQGLIAQSKLNGSNCIIFMNENGTYIYNRHGQRMSNFEIEENELRKLYKSKGWLVLNGEYMNKSKQDENKSVFNKKLVVFDILVNNSQYLIGESFDRRINLLNNLYGENYSDKEYLFGISENIYRVKSYESDFVNLFDDLSKIDMIEGLVLKRKSAKLEVGSSENNNSKSQIKVRKQTKNYKF